MDRKFLVILGAAILILGGIFFFTSSRSDSPSTSSTSAQASNHSTGKLDSKVEVTEFGDFQCPACGAFFPIVSEAKNSYKDQVKFTFKHFPIDAIHPNARAGARAAEAAGNQGKFFEMHDLLYQNQDSWSGLSNPRSVFDSFAKQLALDEAKFSADYAAATTNDIINADIKLGQSKGVSGTPTFFFNGKKVENDDLSTVEKFSAKIDEALKANQ